MNSSVKASTALSLTALIFYIPANVLPFMTIEMYGRRNSSTIWEGIVTLADDGAWFIALVVFLASLLIPLLKLLILFYLSFTASHTGNNPQSYQSKKRLYDFVEVIGRWSMLDIFLLAVLVALVKLGNWAQVRPEAGAVMFALVVIFTMMSSACFKPDWLQNTSPPLPQKKEGSHE
ncbi:paraquat-inducible protein A [Pseudobdellovibrio exovorus]|uniref:Paraquat-inducible protein A n=1 Tax=Pseudobdellovibrio exovorus JSS TaxID=1184267 RepID=M4VNB0_9BACT|nr:paraquat-inducible protein A [Pseudobdellovibrio exovorus]AGH94569.1 hypothetical protein A11Q_349 [Pseudobdellovibrio exovorus JSS]